MVNDFNREFYHWTTCVLSRGFFEHVAYLLGDLRKKSTIYFILLSLSQQKYIFAKFKRIILKININISVERFVFFLQIVCAMMYWWHWHHQEIFQNSREFVLMLKFCWCFSFFFFLSFSVAIFQSSKSRKETIETKRERKAAKTLAIITGAFVVCWLPFFLMALFLPLCGESCSLNDKVASLFLWLGYFNSTLNPVIYTIFSPEFRQAFKRILFGSHRTGYYRGGKL